MSDAKQKAAKSANEYRALQVARNRESDKKKRAIAVRLLMEGKSRNEIVAQYRFSPAIMKSAMQRFERMKLSNVIEKRCAECGYRTYFKPEESHLKHCLACRIELGEVKT